VKDRLAIDVRNLKEENRGLSRELKRTQKYLIESKVENTELKATNDAS
jgi:FtsZ-binding cell division protein ZapB